MCVTTLHVSAVCVGHHQVCLEVILPHCIITHNAEDTPQNYKTAFCVREENVRDHGVRLACGGAERYYRGETIALVMLL